MNDTLTLRFRDALTGKPVAGAQIRFEGQAGTTDAGGAVRFPMPSGLTADERQMEANFQKPGYVTTKLQLRFLAGTLFANRFSVTPNLPAGRVRVVLDWEDAPSALDAHLIKDGAWHLSYRNMRHVQDLAFLDRDDMDGQGPETITVNRLDPDSTYSYFVHDFTNQGKPKSGGLAKGRARVRLYTDRGLWEAFDVAPTLVGDHWDVFRIERGQVIPAGGRR